MFDFDLSLIRFWCLVSVVFDLLHLVIVNMKYIMTEHGVCGGRSSGGQSGVVYVVRFHDEEQAGNACINRLSRLLDMACNNIHITG